MRFRYTFAAIPYLVIAAALLLAATKSTVAAPRLRLDTVLGNIDLELLHEDAPLTVSNFLRYVVTDRYDQSFVHRSEPDFVVQAGGYRLPDGSVEIEAVPRFDPVMNEFAVPNTRGTVAMAKAPGNPNSATSEFFFNVRDNPRLNTEEEGYTVFARVLGNGMTIVDQINNLLRVNIGEPLDTLPVHDYTPGNSVTRDNLVFVNDVQILPTGIPGDYNANGLVEQADLDLVLSNWGKAATELPGGWFQDLPSGNIDQNELDGVLTNWGNSAASGSSLAAGSVPEPSTWLLALMAAALLAHRVHAQKRRWAC